MKMLKKRIYMKKKAIEEPKKESKPIEEEDPQGNKDQVNMQELLAVLDAFRQRTEELLVEVNSLKVNAVTKEFVSKSVVAGIEEFSKSLVPASEKSSGVRAEGGGGSGANKTLGAITDLVSGLAAIAKTFQPQSDPRLLQLGEMGMEFSRIAIMNSMKVQARALGIPMHLELQAHGANSTS